MRVLAVSPSARVVTPAAPPTQRWRRYSNARFVDVDKLWTIGMFFVSGKLFLANWAEISLAAKVVHMGVAITLFSVVLLWLQTKHTAFYTAWRVPIVMGVRLSREFCTTYFLRPSAHKLTSATVATAGDSCLWLGFPGQKQLFYVISRMVAYPIPLKFQIPSLLFASWSGLVTLPERCLMDFTSEAWTQTCSMEWSTGF